MSEKQDTTAREAQAVPSRILARFIKQRWGGRKGDSAELVESVEFDATASVLALELRAIQELQDDSEQSDEIGRANVTWDGPCYVAGLELALQQFFEVDSREDITQVMLDAKRAELGEQVKAEAALLAAERGAALRNQALELLRQAEAVDGLKPFNVVHVHRSGQGVYTVWADAQPEEEDIVKVLDAEFEPDRDEWLGVESAVYADLVGTARVIPAVAQIDADEDAEVDPATSRPAC